MSGIYCARQCTIARRHHVKCEHADDGQCRGCLPRPAMYGALCKGCHYRLARILYELPPARALLAGHLEPGAARRTDHIKRTQGDLPVPLNLAVLDLEVEFDTIPLAWARVHAEEHDLTPPQDGVAYLKTHLASIECSEWIADAWDELAELTSHAHALVPWRAEVTRLEAPCGRCHCMALVMYGGDDWVTCQECGEHIDRQQYGIWSRLLIQEREERAA